MEGTFNPDVIKTLQVLMTTYKAEQKKGKRGQERKKKRQMELGILDLFEREGQKLLKASREEREKLTEDIERNLQEAEQLMIKANTPFSHTSPLKCPPLMKRRLRSLRLIPSYQY